LSVDWHGIHGGWGGGSFEECFNEEDSNFVFSLHSAARFYVKLNKLQHKGNY
jgi:hypothetical protein